MPEYKALQFDNAQLRELGRLPDPMLRVNGAKGFHLISWDEAYRRIAGRIRGADPKRTAFFVTSRGVTNEIYYMAQSGQKRNRGFPRLRVNQ